MDLDVAVVGAGDRLLAELDRALVRKQVAEVGPGHGRLIACNPWPTTRTAHRNAPVVCTESAVRPDKAASELAGPRRAAACRGHGRWDRLARVGAVGHWLWVAVTPTTTVYAICPARGIDDAQTVLGADFDGVLVRDGDFPSAAAGSGAASPRGAPTVGFSGARCRSWPHPQRRLRLTDAAEGGTPMFRR